MLTGNMAKKMREYLLSFVPLLLVLPLVYFLYPSASQTMLFVIAYLWHLFLVFPGTSERMAQKQYRFAFVRFIYLFYAKLNFWINKKNIYILSSFLRAIGLFLFWGIFHYFFRGIDFYLLILGSCYFELVFFTRQQLKFLKSTAHF